ncbi:MAG: HAD family phosphatase [Oscillospiraceae bacterium]|nr:HAD family phosphatase [Oscillospiraceae bacterium]
MIYKNIVFDIGGVLLDFSEPWLLDTFLGGLAPAQRQQLEDWLFGGGRWRQRDLGELTDAQIVQLAQRDLPNPLPNYLQRMLNGHFPAMRPLPTAELIPQLQARGHRLYLLTNTPLAIHENYDAVPRFTQFDGMFASCDVGLLKPDEAFYRAFLQHFHLQAAECLFIDDLPENCVGANRVGIDTFCFDTRDLAGLRKKLGL